MGGAVRQYGRCRGVQVIQPDVDGVRHPVHDIDGLGELGPIVQAHYGDVGRCGVHAEMIRRGFIEIQQGG